MTKHLVALAVLTAASPLFAATYTWQSPTGTFGDPANWLGNLTPTSTPTDQLLFPIPNAAPTISAEHDPWTVNSLTFTAPTTLTSTNTQGLRFAGTAPSLTRNFAPGTGTVTLSAPIQLDTSLAYRDPTNDGSHDTSLTLTALTGPISGPGGITLESGGLVLTGNNSFTGGITLRGHDNVFNTFGGSNLSLASTNAAGTGPITLDSRQGSALLRLQTENSSTLNNITVQGTRSTLFFGNYTVFFPPYPNESLTIQNLTFGPGDSLLWLTQTSFANVAFSIQNIQLQGNATLAAAGFLGTTLGPVSELGGSFSLSLSSGSTYTLAAASTYTGGTSIGGTVNANVTNALSTGTVSLGLYGTLSLNAPSSARNTITGTAASSAINYNANGAAAGHLLTTGQLTLGPAVTSFSSPTGDDTFTILNNGRLTATNAQLALFTRDANITLAPGSAVAATDSLIPALNNLRTNADLLLGIAGNQSGSVTLGTNTPWFGLAGTSTSTFTGTLSARSNLLLRDFARLGNGSPNSFSILPSPNPVAVTLANVTLDSPTSDFSGVTQFLLQGSITLPSANAFGDGNGSSPAPATLAPGASLIVSNSTAINAPLLLSTGSTLTISTAGLSGAGALSRDSQPLSFVLTNASALTGPQLTPGFSQPGDTFFVRTNDVARLNELDPAATYFLAATFNTTQSAGINLNGGSLHFDFSAQSLNPSAAPGASNLISIGDNGAFISAAGALPASVAPSAAGVTIAVPLLASGPVQFGRPSIIGRSARGSILLTSTANSFSSLTTDYIQLIASNPAALQNASITLNGGILGLLSTNFTPSPPSVYNNIVTVLDTAILSNDPSYLLHSAYQFADRLSRVNLAASSLTFYVTGTPGATPRNFTVNELQLQHDATLSVSKQNSSPLILTSLTQDAPHALTITSLQNSGGPDLVINASQLTGPITLAKALVQIDGTMAPSFQPLTITDSSSLSGSGNIQRPVLFTGKSSYLRPGSELLNAQSPGTLTVASLTLNDSTTSQFNLAAPDTPNSPLNDLVIVNGNITLDGNLSINGTPLPGTYTLFTYTGALTDLGLNLFPPSTLSYTLNTATPGLITLTVSPVPEPTSLALLAATTLPLLKRRR